MKIKKLISICSLTVLIIIGLNTAKAETPENNDIMNIDPIVAIIDQETIKLSDLENEKNNYPQLKAIPTEQIYHKLLENYLNKKVILNAAKTNNYEERTEIKKAYQKAKEEILFNAYLAEEVQNLMTKEKLEELYAKEIKNYIPEEEIQARHIMVATENEANSLILQLKEGHDFETLAKQYSLDKNNINLGYFSKKMMTPEFSEAAFKIQVGQISESPIKTAFGWHIVKVEDKRQTTPPSMEESLETLKIKFQKVTTPFILEEEKKKAKIQLFNPFENKK